MGFRGQLVPCHKTVSCLLLLKDCFDLHDFSDLFLLSIKFFKSSLLCFWHTLDSLQIILLLACHNNLKHFLSPLVLYYTKWVKQIQFLPPLSFQYNRIMIAKEIVRTFRNMNTCLDFLMHYKNFELKGNLNILKYNYHIWKMKLSPM